MKCRFLTKGRSKKDANDLAWTAMPKKYPAMPPEADRLLDWLMAVRYPPCGQRGETEDTEKFREV